MPIYICKESSSNKFWSYEDQGNSVLVKWGRLGLAGQSKTHSFVSMAEKRRFLDKKIREKTRKGYALSDEQKKKKEEKIAKLMGHQHKIQRMQWVDYKKKAKKLRFILNYDPKRYVYVEVINSWNKEVHRLLLSKDESYAIEGVAEADRVIEFSYASMPDSAFVNGVREALKELARKVAEVVQRFAAVGVRKLSLGDDDDDEVEPIALDIYEQVGETSASKQVISRFAAMGARTLDL